MKITAKTIHVMGDIHNDIEYVNDYIETNHPDVLILLGDVALFWNKRFIVPNPYQQGMMQQVVVDSYAFENIKPQDTQIFWIMGNHEAFDYVERVYGRNGREPIEMSPNLYYCPTGAVLNINGRDCLFAGGALSIDKEWRHEGADWFPQEVLDESDLTYLVDSAEGKEIHAVFSHTCPRGIPIKAPHDMFEFKGQDPTCMILRRLADMVKPKYWFFGHWHISKGGVDLNMIWQGVNTTTPGWESGGRPYFDISGIFEKDI